MRSFIAREVSTLNSEKINNPTVLLKRESKNIYFGKHGNLGVVLVGMESSPEELSES